MRLRPRNWNDFQHYKQRNPPWVKLHKKLLDDFEFQSLPVAAKALAPMLWLLASENSDGMINAEDRVLAFRLRTSVAELEDAIGPLVQAGFFIRAEDDSGVPAPCGPVAMPETETEAETEKDLPADAGVCDLDSPSGLRIASAATPLGLLGREPRPATNAPHAGEADLTKTHGPYTEDFEAFWKAYPTDKNMAKKPAFRVWRHLSPEKRQAAIAAIPGFKRYCEQNKSWYRPVYAERFLAHEKFEGYAAEPELTPEQIEANKDRADRLMRRGKYAVNYQ